jgi:4a-hydroxytetrahydrobiopterin dehydratase
MGMSSSSRKEAPVDTTVDETLARTLQDLPGWERHGKGIRKTYHFDDFASAAQFVGRVADAAAAVGRQPNIAIDGSRVTLELTPNARGRLTQGDVTLARRVQRLVGDHRRPVGRAGSLSPGHRLAGTSPRPVGPAGP